jgi:ABC-type lipopolysaccharide export system ATPase subunit
MTAISGRVAPKDRKGSSQVEQAERLVSEELQKRKLTESDLPTLPKEERRKVEIAHRLRAQTMVTVKWDRRAVAHGERGLRE